MTATAQKITCVAITRNDLPFFLSIRNSSLFQLTHCQFRRLANTINFNRIQIRHKRQYDGEQQRNVNRFHLPFQIQGIEKARGS